MNETDEVAHLNRDAVFEGSYDASRFRISETMSIFMDTDCFTVLRLLNRFLWKL